MAPDPQSPLQAFLSSFALMVMPTPADCNGASVQVWALLGALAAAQAEARRANNDACCHRP